MKTFVATIAGWIFLASASTAFAQSVVPQVANSKTLFIGDSITAGWIDMPIHVGLYGFQACVVRFALGTAIAQHPGIERVVIEAGTDDIIDGPGVGFDCVLPNQDPVDSVVDMVRTAKAAGLQAFVLSVMPIGWDNRAGQPGEPLVPPFNATLKSAVTAAGAIWVDTFDAFNGHPEYQNDGVHPNETGYHVMDTVYAAANCAAAACTASATQTSISLSSTSVTRPAAVTIEAGVTPSTATGIVNFYNDYTGNFLGSAQLNASGHAAVTAPTGSYPAGSYQIFAEYMGDAGHTLSFSPIVDATLQ